MIGWAPGTWGYHSDDGSILMDNFRFDKGLPYKATSVVGVAIDRTEKKVWFTLDGTKVSEVLENVVGQLFPAVSFQGYAKVRVNFGTDEKVEFKFEPEGGSKISPMRPIRKSRTIESRVIRLSPDEDDIIIRRRFDTEQSRHDDRYVEREIIIDRGGDPRSDRSISEREVYERQLYNSRRVRYVDEDDEVEYRMRRLERAEPRRRERARYYHPELRRYLR